MTKIRMGFIGCGGNARGHVGRVLEMNEDCEIVALCDNSKESIAAVEEQYDLSNLPVFTDFVEMLKEVEMDAA